MEQNSPPPDSLAIDFGTSNTAIARWNSVTRQAELVKLPGVSQQFANRPPLIPSLVYVEDAAAGKVIVGQEVLDRGLDLAGDTRFFANFKRGIGTEIQGYLPELDGVKVSFEQVGAWFLQKLLTLLQETLGRLKSLVLTVPVDSFESYRLWLMDVCQSLEVEQVSILDEPTAAALGYGTAASKSLLVVDFGGGTIDLSLVQLSTQSTQQGATGYLLKSGQRMLGQNKGQLKQTAKVIAKAGANLGGADLDNWLLDYFVATQSLEKSTLTTRLAEKLKISLSQATEAKEVYFDDETFETYTLSLNRDLWQQILTQQGLFEQLDNLITGLLQQAQLNGVALTDINAVLLVGGSIQIPAVQEWVASYFDEDLIKSQQPLAAIAIGALQVSQSVEVQDFLYHGYGIRYWNRRTQAHDWHPIIEPGQAYPISQAKELVLGASSPNQTAIELIIGELSTETTTEVFFDGDRLVTRTITPQTNIAQPLNDREGARSIAQLNPPGNPGRDRLKLLFSVNIERHLCITVEDLLTQETLLNNYIVAKLN
ncbi:MAG: Hsp70 family protein [Cyanobacteria bacterium P01_C01_bin.72]